MKGAVLAGLLLASCAAHLLAIARDGSGVTGEIAFEDFAGGNSRMDSPAFLVAYSEAQFRRIWTLHTTSAGIPPDPQPPPQIDFSKYLVIAFFGGGGSLCEPYRIAGVHEYPQKITVEINHPVQGRNCTCITVLATPYEMIKIARVAAAKPIDYVITSQRGDCKDARH